MSATRRFLVAPRTALDALITGTLPTWTACDFYDADGVLLDPQPADPVFAESSIAGFYTFPVTLSAGQYMLGTINRGATAAQPNEDIQIHYFPDVVGVEDIVSALAAQITTDHGTGSYLRAIGAGAQACTVTVTDGAVPLVGVRVDAFNAAGSALLASGYTGSAGTVVLHLDAGSVLLRGTLSGYSFADVAATVSSTDTISPAALTGSAISTTATTAAGTSGSLAWDAIATGAISGVATGDSRTLTRTVTGLSSAMTKAWLTFKCRGGGSGADSTARLQKAITATSSAAGQITDTGADGTGALSFTLAPGDTDCMEASRAWIFDVQALCADGSLRTLEIGTYSPVQGVTTAIV